MSSYSALLTVCNCGVAMRRCHFSICTLVVAMLRCHFSHAHLLLLCGVSLCGGQHSCAIFAGLLIPHTIHTTQHCAVTAQHLPHQPYFSSPPQLTTTARTGQDNTRRVIAHSRARLESPPDSPLTRYASSHGAVRSSCFHSPSPSLS